MNETDALRDELSRARSTVLQLMPEQIRDILVSYSNCRSTSELREWQYKTAQKLLQFAEARSAHEMGTYASLSPRALCPLCGGSSENPSGSLGFALPEGLLRHLLGSHNAAACAVFEIATALCREHLLELERRVAESPGR